MRDPKRIPLLLARIQDMWEKSPDLRLGQLILNAIEPGQEYHLECEVIVSQMEALYGKKV